jgi:hypothetical protein
MHSYSGVKICLYRENKIDIGNYPSLKLERKTEEEVSNQKYPAPYENHPKIFYDLLQSSFSAAKKVISFIIKNKLRFSSNFKNRKQFQSER